MAADPAMVAALAVACAPLVPVVPPRCPHCGACSPPYGGPADQLGDGTDVCSACVHRSFAEHG